MEKFIEKMEILLQRKEWLFKTVLVVLTLVGLFFFFYTPCWLCWKSNEVISVYVTSGAWILFAAWILWLIVLWVKEEEQYFKELDSDFKNFLKKIKGKPFTRYDIAKFKYAEETPSTSSKYKNLRRFIKRALDAWIIEICEDMKDSRNGRIVYKEKL